MGVIELIWINQHLNQHKWIQMGGTKQLGGMYHDVSTPLMWRFRTTTGGSHHPRQAQLAKCAWSIVLYPWWRGNCGRGTCKLKRTIFLVIVFQRCKTYISHIPHVFKYPSRFPTVPFRWAATVDVDPGGDPKCNPRQANGFVQLTGETIE